MKIITISREYGAGGHSIGVKVAERLGIELYDKDILRETAKLSGIDESLIAKAEEEIRKTDTVLRTLTPASFVDTKDSLYKIHRTVLLKIAEKGPCVIIGRCADVVMKEAGIDSLNVFIHADEVHRAIRVGELMNSSNATEIQKAMKKHDKARHSYYHYYTGRKWGESANYTLCLDSGALGYDTCVDLICAAASAE